MEDRVDVLHEVIDGVPREIPSDQRNIGIRKILSMAGGEVVDDRNRVPLGDEAAYQVGADEPGPSGDKCPHCVVPARIWARSCNAAASFGLIARAASSSASACAGWPAATSARASSTRICTLSWRFKAPIARRARAIASAVR